MKPSYIVGLDELLSGKADLIAGKIKPEQIPENIGKGSDGKSAYQLAVEKGFIGTLEQWLDSLKGKDGSDGREGYTPVKGVDYFDGAKGDKGDTGSQGLQGIQGLKGDKGDTGLKGDKGDAGGNGLGFTGLSAPAPATTGTMTVNMTTDIITITPTGACTFNATGGKTGAIVSFHITTSGTTSRVLTFGTNFRKTGTLATGTTSGRFFTITFRCIDGTIWSEMCRTAAQT